MEVKAEELRYVVCVTPDLLQDASVNIENWIMDKVSVGFRNLISAGIAVGDGVGKPLGLLNQRSGIPICETAAASPLGAFTFQDLIWLAFEIPMNWYPTSAFYMNQRTLALCLTMTDGTGRPLMLPVPITDGAAPGARFSIAGFPVHILTQLPDVHPGTTPILFGSLRNAYLMVVRRGVSMVSDPYSAGFCHLYKFSARIGGATTCPNAMRLLRIR
jgi:HK97 family phage major capsid protein